MPWPSNQPSNQPSEAARRDPTQQALQRWQDQFAASDLAAGIETDSSFERFSQMNDMFSRAFWDDTVRKADTDGFFASYRIEAAPRRGDGFNLQDFALRNAACTTAPRLHE